MASYTKLHCKLHNIVHNCTKLQNIVELLIAHKLFGNVFYYTYLCGTIFHNSVRHWIELLNIVQPFKVTCCKENQIWSQWSFKFLKFSLLEKLFYAKTVKKKLKKNAINLCNLLVPANMYLFRCGAKFTLLFSWEKTNLASGINKKKSKIKKLPGPAIVAFCK